jgi:hypothetical protein
MAAPWLFEPLTKPGWTREEGHLARMVETTGEWFPLEMLQKSERRPNTFPNKVTTALWNEGRYADHELGATVQFALAPAKWGKPCEAYVRCSFCICIFDSEHNMPHPRSHQNTHPGQVRVQPVLSRRSLKTCYPIRLGLILEREHDAKLIVRALCHTDIVSASRLENDGWE